MVAQLVQASGLGLGQPVGDHRLEPTPERLQGEQLGLELGIGQQRRILGEGLLDGSSIASHTPPMAMDQY